MLVRVDSRRGEGDAREVGGVGLVDGAGAAEYICCDVEYGFTSFSEGCAEGDGIGEGGVGDCSRGDGNGEERCYRDGETHREGWSRCVSVVKWLCRCFRGWNECLEKE
jgi:hypothetical protein